MFNERRNALERLLAVKRVITYRELATMFPDVSLMTLRRDVDFLEEQGVCKKMRGGASSLLLTGETSNGTLVARMQENVSAKELIAREAVKFLETGRSIYLDSGSTMQRMVPYVQNERLSIITTSPPLALELCRIGLPAVNLVGGLVNAENQTVSGMQATRFLAGVNIDIAFLSPTGLSARSGFTVGNFAESELKRTVAEKAETVILLLDSSKLCRTQPYTFAQMEDVDVIITDGVLPPDLQEQADRAGTRVIRAVE